jgi:hypothetical protein
MISNKFWAPALIWAVKPDAGAGVDCIRRNNMSNLSLKI